MHIDHSAAPWRHDETHSGRIIAADGLAVCDVFGDSTAADACDANQALIAAAPELLAALRQCLPLVDAYRRLSLGDGDMAAATARRAITLATGATDA
jgi:hypothetical protein